MNVDDWQEQARQLIGRAVLAPSSHNTQPWLFRISEPDIDLYADRLRALPVNDPEGRELAISCGCALMNLRVAAASNGFGVNVRLVPEPAEPDLLARVSFGEHSGASSEEAQLADCIDRRRTYRKSFLSREVSDAVVEQLIQAAQREGAWLRPLSIESDKQQAAALVATGDAMQWANPRWRRELAGWMRPRRRGDGLTASALTAPVVRFVVRSFNMGSGIGAEDRESAETSPLLAVLSTDGDQMRDWLLAGQALQRILLLACRLGLQAAFLNQPIQVASLRPRLQRLAGDAFPQILLSIGYPNEEIPPTPRRALDEVIVAAE